VHRVTLNNLELDGHKLLVRKSKETKDRVVYLNDTSIAALRQHLDARPDEQAASDLTRKFCVVILGTCPRNLGYAYALRNDTSC